MGWTFTRDRLLPNKRAYLDRRFTSEQPGRRHTILKSVMVGSTYIAAAQVEKVGNPTIVYALVALTRHDPTAEDGFHFGWKDMDESMGIGECVAPASILDLLTEAPNDYARRWRRECRQHIAALARQNKAAARIRPGVRIRFKTPLALGDGTHEDVFDIVIAPHGRRSVTAFRALTSGQAFRIPKAAEREHDILGPTPATTTRAA
ncbi:hypothetical protein [Caulobacter sp. X]|uniref:DUF6927 domain-containing protein n=1 Tax=Caulobacter sp. X TaxID=2048901 RepID=UPI000C14F6E3|nr:hypothetical protein [Caulobacter sp. X]PIB95293.1 hypothetical protein CSW60_22375 [Caulobacter sp. X]